MGQQARVNATSSNADDNQNSAQSHNQAGININDQYQSQIPPQGADIPLGAESSQIDLNQYASDSRDLPVGGRGAAGRSNDNLQEMLRHNNLEESKHYSAQSQEQRR